MARGTIKNREQLQEASTSYIDGEGWHFKGQFFPEESLKYSGQTYEFNREWRCCWSTIINGEYHFFAEDAIIFDN